LYNPSFDESTKALYGKLQVLGRTCRWYSMCPMKRFYELGLLDQSWIELYCRGDWASCVRFQKEECGEYHPDWMLPDGSLDYSLSE